MKHTQEPWENNGTIINMGDGGIDIRGCPDSTARAERIVTCVNALAGKRDPAAWVKAAERVGALSAGPEFSVELAEAILDMRASE